MEIATISEFVTLPTVPEDLQRMAASTSMLPPIPILKRDVEIVSIGG
jgi:hypothetical protein